MPVSIPEVVRELSTLAPERVAEVYDFVLFLKTRQPARVDASDEWSDEDVRDVVSASLRYAAQSQLDEAEADDSSR